MRLQAATVVKLLAARKRPLKAARSNQAKTTTTKTTTMQTSALSFTKAALALLFAFSSPALFAGEAAAAKVLPVPTTCVVNGDDFAEHDNPPKQVTYEGKTMTVCCRKCVRKFEKNPAKYTKLYLEAVAKEAAAKKAQGTK